MPHSPELIENIASQLRSEYPPSQYEYIIEKGIPRLRMQPDIQIRTQEGEIVCLVEIGYTRPEKLTAYRNDLKVPDVRWYDKQGNLHGDVKEVSTKFHVEVCPEKVHVYRVWGADCPDCADDFISMYIHDDEEPEITSHETFLRVALPLEGEPERDDRLMEEYYEYQSEDVRSLLITDHLRWALASDCDQCGKIWLAHRDDCVQLIQELGSDHDVDFDRKSMPWEDAKELVRKEYGLSIDYMQMNGVDEFSPIKLPGAKYHLCPS